MRNAETVAFAVKTLFYFKTMINNRDVGIRLGDFNSPAFCLIGAVCSRTGVHNFTANFPCNVGDAIRANVIAKSFGQKVCDYCRKKRKQLI